MLSISGFENEIITEFSLIKKAYCHSQCDFKINICNKSSDTFFAKLGNDIFITVDGRYIFCGYIIKISSENYFSHTEILIKAASCSIQHDFKPEKRIFQNPRKALDSITAFLGNAGNMDIDFEDKTIIEYPILQCNETDFAFIMRVAQSYNKLAFVLDDTKSSKVQLIMGKILDEPPEKIEAWENFSFTETYDNNGNVPEQNYEIIKVVLRNQYIRLGQKVIIKNKTKYVIEENIFLENNVLKYKYILYDLDRIPITDIQVCQKQIVLHAITTDNNDPEFKGRIKVDFNYYDPESKIRICDYLDAEPENQIWIPYQTPYSAQNGGLIFLPDKGDMVEIIYNNNTFIAYEVFGNTPFKEDLRLPIQKYIANIYGKQIIFKEKELEISANGNTVILSDENILFKAGENTFILNNKSLEIAVGKTKILIDDNIKIETGTIDISSTNIAQQINKNITINAKEKVNIKGEKINISGEEIDIQGNKIHLK